LSSENPIFVFNLSAVIHCKFEEMLDLVDWLEEDAGGWCPPGGSCPPGGCPAYGRTFSSIVLASIAPYHCRVEAREAVIIFCCFVVVVVVVFVVLQRTEAVEAVSYLTSMHEQSMRGAAPDEGNVRLDRS
jgi:hypothetical protein